MFNVISEFVAEMLDKALYRHRRRIAQRADRPSHDVRRDATQQIQIFGTPLPMFDAMHDLVKPASSLTTWRALTGAG